MTDFERFVREIPLFASLPRDEIGLLAGSMSRAAYPAGALLFREGEPGDRFSILLSGEIEIIKAYGTPEERVLSIQGPGDFLGEVSLLDPERMRSATARARTAVDLLEMTPVEFEGLINRYPTLAITILRALILRLRHSENSTIRDLQEKNRQLTLAYHELQAAQARLIEQEKLEQELRVARRIQESTLPRDLPSIPGWQLAALWRPARSVSGDFYDFIAFPDNRLGLVIGDVTDKGIPAALLMATTRTLLRFVALDAASHQALSPGQILVRVNELLCPEIPANMFVTCWFGILDPETGRLWFANAGHNLPYRRSAEEVIELRARGMPLGLLPGMNYEEKETGLGSGESLLLFSDGLVEAHNLHKEMFGNLRLSELLKDHGGRSVDLVDFLLSSLLQFTGPAWEQEDDITLVTLTRL